MQFDAQTPLCCTTKA